MAKITINIESIFGGLSPTQNFGTKNTYHASIGIDPDLPVSDSDVRLSGYIRPSAMEKFSSSTVTGTPLWLVPNPKDTNVYHYDSAGKVYSIDTNLSVSVVSSGLSSASGNGAEYYDNYIYFAKNTDIARYGALNGSPSITETYWTGTLGKTALTNTTYPTIRGISIPNHHMHRHTDNKLYICDVTSGNKGVLHYIKTSKTTVEGDTNDGSSHTALDFGYGYYPVIIESLDTQLAVALIEGTSTSVKQQRAAVSFWNTTSATFQKLIQVEFPDPLITAMKNVNGTLYVWSGYATGGCRLSRFIGGYSFEEVWYSEDTYPPLQSAVDAEMNRIVWGSATTYPESSASVFSYGSRSAAVGNGVHNILKSTSSGSNQLVTSVKYIQTTAFGTREPIVGWKDDSSQGLDKKSTTYGVSVFRSDVFRIGKPFQIKRIFLPLGQAVAANMTATVKAYTDNGSSNTTIATINSTNYANSERNIVLYPSVNGYHDFFIEIRLSGTALLTFALPIRIELETKED